MATTGIELAKESTDVKSELVEHERVQNNLKYLAENYSSAMESVALCYNAAHLHLLIEEYFENELKLDHVTAHEKARKAFAKIVEFRDKTTARGRKKL